MAVVAVAAAMKAMKAVKAMKAMTAVTVTVEVAMAVMLAGVSGPETINSPRHSPPSRSRENSHRYNGCLRVRWEKGRFRGARVSELVVNSTTFPQIKPSIQSLRWQDELTCTAAL